jgi:ATP/maltotriose-dependent transcriptional regulator MalT
VIAMQGNVTMATVARCMPVLFHELRRDGQIDRALAAARSAVFDRPDWWMPVLFLRLRDGMLWGEPQTALPPLQRPQRAAKFVGREAELAYFTEKLVTEHLALITGMPGVGKTTLALELAERVAEATNIFWYSFSGPTGIAAIIEKLAIFLARNGQDQLWRLLRSGGQLPTPEVLLDYLLPMLCGHGYVLCLDNFQYIDDDPFVQQCVARLRSEPYAGTVSLIITSRRLPKSIQTTSFDPLDGLRLDDTRTLLSMHGVELPEQLVADLHAAISGNAKLLLLAVGLLQRVQDPARMVSGLSRAQDIVRFLMDEVRADLTDAEDAVMGAVAVLLGEPGTRDAIEFILERSGVWDTLYSLCNRYLLEVIERPTGEADSFYPEEYVQHSIVREFYYDVVLSKRQRQGMHRRAGQYYETDEPDALKAARHYQRAGEYARAADLATADVGALINRGQARALERLLEQIPTEQLDLPQRAAVATARGEVAALLASMATREHSSRRRWPRERLPTLAQHSLRPRRAAIACWPWSVSGPARMPRRRPIAVAAWR